MLEGIFLIKVGICRALTFLFVSSLIFTPTLFAAPQQGHYYPGIASLRDNIQPPPGQYLAVYDWYYHSSRFNDPDGKKMESISSPVSLSKDIGVMGFPIQLNFTGNVTVEIKAKLDNVIHQLCYIRAFSKKVLGAQYAFMIAPSFGYQRIKVLLNAKGTGTITGSLGKISVPVAGSQDVKLDDNKYGFGDPYIRPLWLSWVGKHYSCDVNYGVYVPIGSYDKSDLANIGMGFLTSMWQTTAAYYPWEHKATALILTATYEMNSKKYDVAVKPGQVMTLEYGISQYLSKRLEVGASGYSGFQITDDTGWQATFKDVRDHIQGVGGEVNFWVIPGKLMMELRYTYEYSSVHRFAGQSGTCNFVYKWGDPAKS